MRPPSSQCVKGEGAFFVNITLFAEFLLTNGYTFVYTIIVRQ